jgi:uncharacterized protein YbgA (DUF1722 family)/uncharacterized protein YbbK (DUF523 family)
MENNFAKPKILVSKCIEFDSCRYNGQMISSDFVKKLKKFVDFNPVCPEVEIGLGVPRNPIRTIEKKGIVKLIQPETKKNVTKDMIDFSNRFLDDLKIDGVILKSKSPSCGIKDVKIYPTVEKSSPLRRGKGFFGGAVIEKFALYPVEDEDRLRNHIIKENFLRKIFTYASFRDVKKKKSINELIKFHANNKFLIMSYNQKELKELGNITANRDKKQIFDVLKDYEYHLKLAFSKSPRCTSNINVLSHSFGYVSEKLKIEEKKLFLDSLEQFRKGHIGLTIPISIMNSWITRFDEDYLKKQTYFNPYPDDLMEVENVNFCAARDFWK